MFDLAGGASFRSIIFYRLTVCSQVARTSAHIYLRFRGLGSFGCVIRRLDRRQRYLLCLNYLRSDWESNPVGRRPLWLWGTAGCAVSMALAAGNKFQPIWSPKDMLSLSFSVFTAKAMTQPALAFLCESSLALASTHLSTLHQSFSISS